MLHYIGRRIKHIIHIIMRVKEKKAAKHGSANYWTHHMVANKKYINADHSLDHFHWRNTQYPGYLDLMPVIKHDNKVVLDYGCGPGNDLVGLSIFSNPKQLIGVDVSKPALDISARRLALHDRKAKLLHIEEENNSIPLESNSVDFIHTSGVLHHCKNLDNVLIGFYRLLKPGGEMQVMVYNYNSLWLHLYTAYIHQIEMGLYKGHDVLEAFRRLTDGPYCPISKCYKPDDFLKIVNSFGFKGEFIGAAISLTELSLLPKRIAAIKDQKLPVEHRNFLSRLSFDNQGIPLYKGQVSGINACYKFVKD
jgi:SAM-dependent methyltransferase